MSSVDSAWASPFVETAVDPDEARREMQAQLAKFDELRGDVARFGDVADDARLARAHARAAHAAFLLGEYATSIELSGVAVELFEKHGKDAAAWLNHLRIARARTQSGSTESARVWLDRQTGDVATRYRAFLLIAEAELAASTGLYELAAQHVADLIDAWRKRPNVDLEALESARAHLLAEAK